MSEMYNYTGCGLQNVWLRNGFTKRETSQGAAVSIHDLEGLHRSIGIHVAKFSPKLNKDEIRFLRKELEWPQVELAEYLGVGDTTIRNWERGDSDINPSAERLLRATYIQCFEGDGEVRKLVEQIGQYIREAQAHTETQADVELKMKEGECGWQQEMAA